VVEVVGTRVTLRAMRPDEFDAVWNARQELDDRVQPGGSPPRQRVRDQLQRSGTVTDGQLDLGIEADGRLIGEIQARGRPAQALPPGVFELGIVVWDPADRGKGYGSEAIALLTGWLFEHGGAGRVQVTTEVGNGALRRALRNVGFAFEGVLRGYMPYGNRRDDYAMYGATKPDWERFGAH
jgi:RimJ/RimL family protein N-acetyltransferase